MAVYKIYFRESVEKDFSAIPRKYLEKILHRIEALAESPRPPDCEKLTGQERYRVRQGRYRIAYSIQDEVLTVWIVKVGHRKDVATRATYQICSEKRNSRYCRPISS